MANFVSFLPVAQPHHQKAMNRGMIHLESMCSMPDAGQKSGPRPRSCSTREGGTCFASRDTSIHIFFWNQIIARCGRIEKEEEEDAKFSSVSLIDNYDFTPNDIGFQARGN